MVGESEFFGVNALHRGRDCMTIKERVLLMCVNSFSLSLCVTRCRAPLYISSFGRRDGLTHGSTCTQYSFGFSKEECCGDSFPSLPSLRRFSAILFLSNNNQQRRCCCCFCDRWTRAIRKAAALSPKCSYLSRPQNSARGEHKLPLEVIEEIQIRLSCEHCC